MEYHGVQKKNFLFPLHRLSGKHGGFIQSVHVVFITIFLFYKMRINQLKHELYLRTKIARDLHDDVGSTLSSLHMVSALATKKIDR